MDGEAAEGELCGAGDGIFTDDFSGEVADDDAEGVALDADFESGGAEADRGGVGDGLDVDGLFADGGVDGPGGVFGEGGVGGFANADDVVAEGGDADLCGTGLHGDAVGEGFDIGESSDHDGLGCIRSLGESRTRGQERDGRKEPQCGKVFHIFVLPTTGNHSIGGGVRGCARGSKKASARGGDRGLVVKRSSKSL